jgi:ABC-type multidrug transport system ATPase subunit
MRQRLGIAAALLGDPPVLLLDEPTNGLDPEGIIWIRHLLRQLAREGRTVLVSSHLMNETAAFADHLVVLGRGRLLADIPTQDFIEQHSRPRVRVRTSDPSRLRAALLAQGHTVAEDADGRWVVDGATAEQIGAAAAREGIHPSMPTAAHDSHLRTVSGSVLGGSSPRRDRPVWMPGRTWLSWVIAAVVATSVITLGPSGAQVSVR